MAGTQPSAPASEIGSLEKLEADGRARNNFWRGQVLPRWKSLIFTPAFIIPLIAAIVVAVGGPRLVTVSTSISTLAGAALNFAALSFGASVTAAVLAISLPSTERVERWAAQRGGNLYRSSYSDLIFSLAWSAQAQFAVVVVSILAYLVGGNESVLPAQPRESHVVLLAIALFIFTYAAVQLLTIISVLSQVGNVIDWESWRAVAKRERDAGPSTRSASPEAGKADGPRP